MQESFEHESLQLADGRNGHGLFTTALLEALTGARIPTPGKNPPPADLNGNGLLSIDEWCRYARLRTAMLSSPELPYLPAGKQAQTPKVLPSLSFPDIRQFELAPAPPGPR